MVFESVFAFVFVFGSYRSFLWSRRRMFER